MTESVGACVFDGDVVDAAVDGVVLIEDVVDRQTYFECACVLWEAIADAGIPNSEHAIEVGTKALVEGIGDVGAAGEWTDVPDDACAGDVREVVVVSTALQRVRNPCVHAVVRQRYVEVFGVG